jgi:hypothetical protein
LSSLKTLLKRKCELYTGIVFQNVLKKINAAPSSTCTKPGEEYVIIHVVEVK